MAKKRVARKAPKEVPLPTLLHLCLEAERLAAVLMLLEEAHGGIAKGKLHHRLLDKGLLMAPFCDLMPHVINKSLWLARELGRFHDAKAAKEVA